MSECCNHVDECVKTIAAGRLMFHAIMGRLCNGGTEADDGKGAERLDDALAAWAEIDPKMKAYYR